MFDPMNHMMKLKGKDYLQVMWRLVWFREEHPNWCIDTSMVEHGENFAVFTCKIIDDCGNQVSSGYGSESVRDFGDYLEKAETKAVGRALAMLGYGTQFAPELDEEERIVDSPVERKRSARTNDAPPSPPPVLVVLPARKTPAADAINCEKCGKALQPYAGKNNKLITPDAHAAISKARFGKVVCIDCINAEKEE